MDIYSLENYDISKSQNWVATTSNQFSAKHIYWICCRQSDNERQYLAAILFGNHLQKLL